MLLTWLVISRITVSVWAKAQSQLVVIVMVVVVVAAIGTSVRRSSGRRSGVAVRAVDCWQRRSGH